MHEFFPTRQILYRKHVEPVAFYEVCGDPEESIKHFLVDCTVAKQFWNQTKVATSVKIPTLNAVTWATDLLSELCPKQDQAVIMCGMWSLWMLHNKHRHGELLMTVQQAVNWVKDKAFDLWQLGHSPDQPATVRDIQTLKRPEPGLIKINTDAAFFMESKQGATVFSEMSGALF
jgi:hypothetical protein